jgi:hypothetical protein
MTKWETFIDWYVTEVYGEWEDRGRKYSDQIHHIIYHWTEKKHPKKIELVWKLWQENHELKRNMHQHTLTVKPNLTK